MTTQLTDQDVEAVLDCLRSGWLTMGPRIQELEQALAERLGAAHAIAVSSGQAGIQLACLAAGVAEGDEVAVLGPVSPGTTGAVRAAGAGPADAASAATRVAVAAGDAVDEARAAGALTIEDQGERFAPPRGDLTCYAFSGRSPLGVGEGGAVATQDDELARRVRLLRSHAMTSGSWDRHRGHAESYDVVDIGFNYRLDEPRAALALSRLRRV